MHIPDGFIDGKTAVTTAILSAVAVGVSLRKVKRELPPRKIPLLGLSAAFLFAAQMVNFPVAGGTSGHLLGGTLVAALLGPSAAILVVTTVLTVQCLLFADGGVTALGANIFNMAVLGSAGGYAMYWALTRVLRGHRGRVTALAFAAWCSAVLASISCAGQLAWSGTVAWSVGFPAMTTVHMLIGLGEGVISALAFLGVQRARPELIADADGPVPPKRVGELVRYGLIVTFGVAIFVAPFACSWPDGLERVASKLGFARLEVRSPAPTLAPDYQMPGIHWTAGATAMSGALGSLVVFLLAVLLGRLLVPKAAGAPDASLNNRGDPNQARQTGETLSV
jgi:cobalt/nickel transport system permease protein